MANCRTCGAAVRWEFTAAGKKIPLDPEPVPDGNLALVDGVIVGGAAVYNETERFVSHFFTCPDAKQHRRSGR